MPSEKDSTPRRLRTATRFNYWQVAEVSAGLFSPPLSRRARKVRTSAEQRSNAVAHEEIGRYGKALLEKCVTEEKREEVLSGAPVG
jgi:hypothetical protein